MDKTVNELNVRNEEKWDPVKYGWCCHLLS